MYNNIFAHFHIFGSAIQYIYCNFLVVWLIGILGERLSLQAIEDVFRVSVASSKHEGELGEFETVMQT